MPNPLIVVFFDSFKDSDFRNNNRSNEAIINVAKIDPSWKTVYEDMGNRLIRAVAESYPALSFGRIGNEFKRFTLNTEFTNLGFPLSL